MKGRRRKRFRRRSKHRRKRKPDEVRGVGILEVEKLKGGGQNDENRQR